MIIIINRCQYLTVSIFLMAEMNDPNFLNYYVVSFFLTTGRKKKKQHRMTKCILNQTGVQSFILQTFIEHSVLWIEDE